MMKVDGYHNQQVLVTGAGGFIGSHLCEALVASGAKVRALVKYNSRADRGCLARLPPESLENIDIIAGDVRDAGQMRGVVQGCKVVFHLAALIGIPYSYVAAESYVDTNIRGTLNVLEAARAAGAQRLVHISTSEVYGTAEYTPIDEKHPQKGQSPYSASKIGADKLAESFYRSFELPVVIVRPFNTFGPRQSARAVIPTIAAQLLSRCEVLKLGSLHPVRDFTFVTDTARGMMLAGAADDVLGEQLNLGTGEGISVGELASLLMQIVGYDAPIEEQGERVRPDASEVLRLIAGNERARTLLGWRPQVSLEQGLGRVVDYLRENLVNYDVSRYAI